MADTQGQADIRGINIDKLVKGFADEEYVFKKFVTNSTTNAREVRWFQKTAGALDVPDTSGITGSQIAQSTFKARPFVAQPSWTRNTSYIKPFRVESEMISMEDIKDSDVDILATTVRDLVRAVANQVDSYIYDTITDASGILTGAATGTGWDDLVAGNPILDLLTAKQQIRANGYNPEGAVLAINSVEYKNLLNFIISVKGSSIPQFASEKVRSGVVMEILGLKVLVSQNATTDEAALWIPNRSATWKSFTPISSVVIEEPLIGKKVRVLEEGVCLPTDVKSIYVITDTVT
tara:strand:+ start:3785 stop:4660 length:876 start_codon:yes stop_codon:yes gene_type:complete